jgi:hypothetical protein
MVLNHTIDDCEGLEINADFSFHRELDGQIVFDGAWSVNSVLNADYENITDEIDDETVTSLITNWLAKRGEDEIYREAQKWQ